MFKESPEPKIQEAPQTTEIKEAEIHEKLPLRAAKAAKLFFLSFRFSQGSSDLQEDIFKYLHYRNPQWIMDEDFKTEVRRITEPMIQRFLERGLHEGEQGKKYIRETTHLELEKMQTVFNWGEIPDPKSAEPTLGSAIADVAKRIVSRDRRFLVEKNVGGRKRTRQPRAGTAATDPFISHLCHYGLLEHDTGMEEYNQMFRDVTAYLRQSAEALTLSASMLDGLREVISVYNKNHKDTQVSFP